MTKWFRLCGCTKEWALHRYGVNSLGPGLFSSCLGLPDLPIRRLPSRLAFFPARDAKYALLLVGLLDSGKLVSMMRLWLGAL